MLKFYLKRILFVVLIVAMAMGYSLWKEGREAEAQKKTERFALVVAKLAVAEALHHDSDDAGVKGKDSSAVTHSWQTVKDSLLKSWNLNSDSVDAYINSFEGQEEKLATFWKLTRINVDSLANLELKKLSPPDSALADSALLDSTSLDTALIDTASVDTANDN